MYKNLRILLLITLGIISYTTLSAQGGANSIFSRFGIGDLTGNTFVHNRSMGGIGAAYIDPTQINITNPASYSFLRVTAFDVGVSAKYSNISDQQYDNKLWSGNLDYLSLAFPLRNPLNEIFDRSKKEYWFGMSFSLVPISAVNYNVIKNNIDPDFGSYQSVYKGTGGTYKALWGNSLRYKDFSFGANMGWMFGKINYESNTRFVDLPNAFVNRFSNEYTLKGFIWDVGAIYKRVLNKSEVEANSETVRKIVTIGIHGNTPKNIRTNAKQIRSNEQFVYESQTGSTFPQLRKDTFSFDAALDGTLKMPASIGTGVSYSHEHHFLAEIDYTYTNWAEYNNEANPEKLNSTNEINIGGYFRPDYKSFKYYKKIYYRFGAQYRKEAISINQMAVKNYGLTFGVGLPFYYQRKVSHINLGISLGKRSQTDGLSENYVKLGLGLTFNDDEWFIKRKYN